MDGRLVRWPAVAKRRLNALRGWGGRPRRSIAASVRRPIGGGLMTEPIPEAYRGSMPYLAVENAAEAINFYTRAFGATERVRMSAPGGSIGHAELQIGEAVIMLSDPFPQSSTTPPSKLGGTSVSVMLYVEDVDAFVGRAVDAGATIVMPVEDQFWGDRFGSITDPFGHNWSIATHVEDVPPEEMAERAERAMASMS